MPNNIRDRMTKVEFQLKRMNLRYENYRCNLMIEKNRLFLFCNNTIHCIKLSTLVLVFICSENYSYECGIVLLEHNRKIKLFECLMILKFLFQAVILGIHGD